MDRYKVVRKKAFEKHARFEERINSLALEGWKAISITSEGTSMIVLMEKSK